MKFLVKHKLILKLSIIVPRLFPCRPISSPRGGREGVCFPSLPFLPNSSPSGEVRWGVPFALLEGSLSMDKKASRLPLKFPPGTARRRWELTGTTLNAVSFFYTTKVQKIPDITKLFYLFFFYLFRLIQLLL